MQTGTGEMVESMTEYLDALYMNGDVGDDSLRWSDGSGWERYGRRVLEWDSQGFHDSTTYESVEKAEQEFARLRRDEASDIVQQSDNIGELLDSLEDGKEPYWLDECNIGADEILDEITRRHGPDLADYNSIDYYRRAWKVKGRSGMAFRIIRPSRDRYVQIVAVGDDRVDVVELDDLEWLNSSEYCVECGQIGCTWHTMGEDD